MGKGAGRPRATAPDGDPSRSRRRGKGGAEADGTRPRRLPVERRQIVAGAIVLALLILVFMVTQRDGGAPQANSFAAATQAEVVSWRFVADTEDGSDVLCRHDSDPCDPDDMWAALTQDATCAMHGRLWLGQPEMPIVLRAVSVTLNGTAWSGDYTVRNNTTTGPPINVTTTYLDRALDWEGGWWWRAEAEHVTFRQTLPCDVHNLSLVLKLAAEHVDGDPWEDTQSARIELHQAFLSRLGEVPRASPIE